MSLEQEIKNGNIDAVRNHIKNGMPLKGHEIHFAAQSDQLEIVKLLIEAGCHVDSKNSTGWTALNYAAEGGCHKTYNYLIQMGADVNNRDSYGRLPREALMDYPTLVKLYNLLLEMYLEQKKYKDEGRPIPKMPR
jgi:ankyrin repeat protein